MDGERRDALVQNVLMWVALGLVGGLMLCATCRHAGAAEGAEEGAGKPPAFRLVPLGQIIVQPGWQASVDQLAQRCVAMGAEPLIVESTASFNGIRLASVGIACKLPTSPPAPLHPAERGEATAPLKPGA